MLRSRITLVALGLAAAVAAIVAAVAGASGSATPSSLRLFAVDLEAAGRVVFAGPRVRLPIVGGTKAYAGARGELVITELNEKTDRYDITLQS